MWVKRYGRLTNLEGIRQIIKATEYRPDRLIYQILFVYGETMTESFRADFENEQEQIDFFNHLCNLLQPIDPKNKECDPSGWLRDDKN